MTITARFQEFLAEAEPPAALGAPLAALYWCAKGDWDRAHGLVDSLDDADGMWVHAHLHRVEGDASNAAYWYRRAGHPVAAGSFEAERGAIGDALLGGG